MSVNLDPRPGDPFPLTTHLLQKITELERENAALRADKERLNWLFKHGQIRWPYRDRAAIDAARKEQP